MLPLYFHYEDDETVRFLFVFSNKFSRLSSSLSSHSIVTIYNFERPKCRNSQNKSIQFSHVYFTKVYVAII